jgi:CRISPR-associated protein Csb1
MPQTVLELDRRAEFNVAFSTKKLPLFFGGQKMTVPSTLAYTTLKDAVAGSAAAFRLTLRLEAVSPKVFPPTYEGGKYATEERIISGLKLPCVLLDSVASQANRMEFCLQDAWNAGEIKLPVVSTDFSAVDHPGLPKVTSLQAPHRIVDALLRDTTLSDGKKSVKFRQSYIGKQLDQLSPAYATPLLTYAPHCLVFGMWDSTGPRGGLGVKFARAVVSEIIGVNAQAGVVTGGRIDPASIRRASGVLYKTEDGWTLDENKALKKGKEPIKLGTTEKKKGDGSPAEANHGNIPPSFAYAQDDNKRPLRDENGKLVHKGGFTIEYAEQTTVLSLSALRRLRFPKKRGETSSSDDTARTYLAALGLLGATLAVEAGYDLRSRCILRAKDAVTWHLLGKPGGEDKPFSLDKEKATKLYKDALEAAEKEGFPIHIDEIVLTPLPDLVTLVRESMKLAAVEAGEGE